MWMLLSTKLVFLGPRMTQWWQFFLHKKNGGKALDIVSIDKTSKKYWKETAGSSGHDIHKKLSFFGCLKLPPALTNFFP